MSERRSVAAASTFRAVDSPVAARAWHGHSGVPDLRHLPPAPRCAPPPLPPPRRCGLGALHPATSLASRLRLFPSMAAMEGNSRLGTYLCAADDVEAVSHGYRRNSRGTVWAVEHAGAEYVRLQGQRGLYLGPADPAAALNAATPSCSVVQGVPSTPNDSAFLWTPRREDERGAAGCLTLSGPLDRLLRDSFGDTHKAVSLDFDVAPEESAWVLEAVPAEQAARPPPCRAQSCDARMQVTAATLDTTSSSFVRFYSAKRVPVG